MEIILDNRDTQNVHIDTYAMLTGDQWDESEIDYMREELKDDTLTYDDFEWEYNHDEIVKDFAHASIEIVKELTSDDGIIKNIAYVSHGSPQFYNYTTDWYIAEYEVDTPKLHEYIASHYDDVLKKAQSYDDYVCTGEVSKDNLAHAGLCHYIDNAITADDYNMAMWECEYEVYSGNTTVSKITKN